MKSLILRFHRGGQSILFTYKNKHKHRNRKIRDSKEEIHKHSILEIVILRFQCLGARCVAKTIRNAGRANRKIKMLLAGRPAPPCPPGNGALCSDFGNFLSLWPYARFPFARLPPCSVHVYARVVVYNIQPGME